MTIRHEMLEIAREVRAMTRERDALDADAMLGADDPSQPRMDLYAPDTKIEMAPVRIDGPHVVTMTRRELTQRADQPAATQHDLHDNSVGLKANVVDTHSFEAQQARECGGGAHGIIDLQARDFDIREPTVDPVRVASTRRPVAALRPLLKNAAARLASLTLPDRP